jgi:hypothetical protein
MLLWETGLITLRPMWQRTLGETRKKLENHRMDNGQERAVVNKITNDTFKLQDSK